MRSICESRAQALAAGGTGESKAKRWVLGVVFDGDAFAQEGGDVEILAFVEALARIREALI